MAENVNSKSQLLAVVITEHHNTSIIHISFLMRGDIRYQN